MLFYLTARTSGPRTNAVLVSSALTPWSQVAFTTILVLPKPKTKVDLIVLSAPPAIAPMVAPVDLPRKMSDPSRVMVQAMWVRSVAPVLLMVPDTPSPPFTLRLSAGAGSMMTS